jgi:peptidyl-prolyl cis-trans isomerase B (cyclophilin B)
MPRRPLALALTVLLAGCGGSGQGSSSQSSAGGDLPAGCRAVSEPEPRNESLPRPPLNVKPGEALEADVETSCGSFTIGLDTGQEPKTASSFAYLARKGFYDGLSFHRVVPQFVIQGGDPLGDGTGGPGYEVVEPPPQDTVYRRGVVAMAKTAVQPPGASGSQFFVVSAPADAGLPPVYAVLGRVTSGMKTVERIASLADPALGPKGGQPREPVVIDRITIASQRAASG